MPLKKRRIELHTMTDQLLFVGGAAAGAAASHVQQSSDARASSALSSMQHEGARANAPNAPNAPNADAARLGVLRDAARSLSLAMKTLRTLELSGQPAAPDVGRGVDFYDEVRRFEILLIERALQHTGGSQVRAASLLGLKTTTLNSKIKGYRINSKESA